MEKAMKSRFQIFSLLRRDVKNEQETVPEIISTLRQAGKSSSRQDDAPTSLPSNGQTNASCTTTTTADAATAFAKKFEVLFCGRVVVAHKKAPPALIDECIEKFGRASVTGSLAAGFRRAFSLTQVTNGASEGADGGGKRPLFFKRDPSFPSLQALDENGLSPELQRRAADGAAGVQPTSLQENRTMLFTKYDMGSKVISEANSFVKFLKLCQDESKDMVYMDDVSVLLGKNDELLLNIINKNQPVFICEKAQVKCEPEPTESLEDDSSLLEEVPPKVEQDPGPEPLSVMKARQLLSWYTMAQNPGMPLIEAHGTLHPLWVRCDKSDPCATAWFGAETIYNGNKSTGIKLYTVSCKGPTGDEASFATLDDLKQEHQKRHHPTTMLTKAWAQYNLFCSMKEESMVFESQSSVIANLKWNNVEKILECPPLSSVATLKIKVAVGDIRSPMYQTYREMEFLLALAEGLRTGETEWLEPIETQSAVDLTRGLIEELESIAHGVLGNTAKASESQKTKTDATAAFGSMVIERGDLDFTEQLWEKMRRSVTSYEDITDCLKVVIKAVRHGQIKPWIHKDSSSSLSKLILKSYQQQIDAVPLAGLTPASMLLELGLDKIRKDFINYLVGKELTTLNYLSYYLDTEVDLQEQVIRVRKLHHLLEILGTCSTFLSLPHDRLFLFTQSCLQYYKTSNYDEDHVFQLQIKPALISYFYEKEQPFSWAVEVSSGQGTREVKTSYYLSDKSLVDHISFDLDLPLDVSVSGENEMMSYYRTVASCSLVSFT